MKHTEKYLQAKWVTENPDGYDERDVVDAKRYCNAYLDGYNQALHTLDVIKRREKEFRDNEIRDWGCSFIIAIIFIIFIIGIISLIP